MDINKQILLCGFSRSGTTWLSKIFDSVPSTILFSEPDKRVNTHLKFSKVIHCVTGLNNRAHEEYKNSLNELLDHYYCNLRSYPYFKKQYSALPHNLYWGVSFFLQFLNYIAEKGDFNQVKLPEFCFKKKCKADVVWKSVNQLSNIQFLQKIFPDMKIIFLLRNPFSTLTSILNHEKMTIDGQDFRRIYERKGAPFFEKYDIDFKEISSWCELKKKALLWRIDCESAYIKGTDNPNFMTVLYEDLASDPADMTEKIFNFLGFKVPMETRRFLLQSSGKLNPPLISKIISSGYFGVYRKSGTNLNKWKNMISDKNFELISSVLENSPLMKFWQ
ncbi:MAG: sulfotransferase [Desulfobacula sp.]|nr:sulfotransferase [Desulfobacula sp.]